MGEVKINECEKLKGDELYEKLKGKEDIIFRKVIKEDEDGNFTLWVYFKEGVIYGIMRDRTFPTLMINEKLLNENEELKKKYIFNPYDNREKEGEV